MRSARRRGRCLEGYPTLRTTAWPPRWSSSAARAHAVVVSVLTPAEVLIAARRLAGARPHLAAVAGIVHQEDLWQLCRDELTGVDVRVDGWDIRGRWFGVVVGATPRLGELPTRPDDPLARDRRPDRTARTPRLALTRWSPALTGSCRARICEPGRPRSPGRRSATRPRSSLAPTAVPISPVSWTRPPTTRAGPTAVELGHLPHRPRTRPVLPRPLPGVFRPARDIDVYVRARPVARLGARFPPPYQEPGTGARSCPAGRGFLMPPGHRASSGVCPRRRLGRERLVPVRISRWAVRSCRTSEHLA